jgi:hypothetical protein
LDSPGNSIENERLMGEFGLSGVVVSELLDNVDDNVDDFAF